MLIRKGLRTAMGMITRKGQETDMQITIREKLRRNR